MFVKDSIKSEEQRKNKGKINQYLELNEKSKSFQVILKFKSPGISFSKVEGFK